MEERRRKLRAFVADNLKQILSGSVTHFEITAGAVLLNLGVSSDVGDPNYVSECDWWALSRAAAAAPRAAPTPRGCRYLVLFILDTAFGCLLTITVRAQRHAAAAGGGAAAHAEPQAHALTVRVAAQYAWSEPLSRCSAPPREPPREPPTAPPPPGSGTTRRRPTPRRANGAPRAAVPFARRRPTPLPPAPSPPTGIGCSGGWRRRCTGRCAPL